MMIYEANPKFEIGCAAIAVTVVLAIGFLAGRLTLSCSTPPTCRPASR